MSSNESQDKLKTEQYFVLYIDLLGSENRIKCDTDDTWLNAINKLYLRAIDYTKSLDENLYRIEYQVKIFSDNIVVAVKRPIKFPGYDNRLYFLMYVASYIQTHALIDYSWLLRGCLTIGDLYIDNNFVWGKALTRVINIESNLAVYPRIIMDEELVINRREVADEPKQESGNNRSIEETDFLFPVMKDSDGLFSRDYFAIQVQSDPNITLREIVDKSNNIISDLEQEADKAMEILQKIEWVKSYVKLAEKSESMNLEPPKDKDVLYQ